MKSLTLTLLLASASAFAGEKSVTLTTEQDFATVSSTISKRMAQCYETSIVGVNYQVYDDIDVAAKTGTVIYRQSGIGARNVPIARIEFNGPTITITKTAAIVSLKKLQANVESWLAGSKDCK